METPRLENLILTEEEMNLAREQVQLAAYFKWRDAGCPEGKKQHFWCEAELEWIEYFYVPDRYSTNGETDDSLVAEQTK